MRLVRAQHKGTVGVRGVRTGPRPGVAQGDKDKNGDGCLTGI